MRNYLRFIPAGLLLWFMVIGCNDEMPEVPEHILELKNLTVIKDDASKKVTLTREITFGGDVDSSMNWFDSLDGLGWLAGLEVDDRGRVYIGDYSGLEIHAFQPDGTHIKSVGERGRGPGELRSISEIRIVSGQLNIFDPLRFRLHSYSLESLELESEKNVYINRVSETIEELGYRQMHHTTQLRPDGIFLAGFMKHLRDARVDRETYNLDEDRPIRYFLKNSEGELLSDNSFRVNDAGVIFADVEGRHISNMFPLPFLGNSLISISADNYTYTSLSREFLIKSYDPDGNYVRALYFPFENKILKREELLKKYERGNETTQNLLLHAELPEYWPALNDLLVDDEDRLWVSTNVEDLDIVEWWVIKETGEVIATFKWPRNYSIEKIKNGYVYALETDEETGLQQVVRYAIEMGE